MPMKLTVNFVDKYVVKDGVPMFAGARLVNPDPNYRVIQWLDTKGWVEVYVGERVWLDTDTSLAPYVTLYDQLKAEKDAEIAAILATPDTPA